MVFSFFWQVVALGIAPNVWSVLGAIVISGCVLAMGVRKWKMENQAEEERKRNAAVPRAALLVKDDEEAQTEELLRRTQLEHRLERTMRASRRCVASIASSWTRRTCRCTSRSRNSAAEHRMPPASELSFFISHLLFRTRSAFFHTQTNVKHCWQLALFDRARATDRSKATDSSPFSLNRLCCLTNSSSRLRSLGPL